MSGITLTQTSQTLGWTFSGDWPTVKLASLKIASYLTEPICKVREYFYTFYILDKTCQTTAQKVMKKVLLTLGILVCALLTPFTAPAGAAIRGLVAIVESKPFIYLEKARIGKKMPENRQVTLVSHNQCYMPAGFSITDGHVMPPSKERMDANIKQIKTFDPDILCLYEVPDICNADYLSSQLQEYPFIIPVAGIRAIGPSSMMYVASKYEIVKDSIEFIPFVKGTEITGRAQFSEKGFLSFEIKSQDQDTPFATVISTHLQHSEISNRPEPDDVKARAKQMQKIIEQIRKKLRYNVIFTGDLNQEEAELQFQQNIGLLRRDLKIVGQPTWGGDQWSAMLMGKPASGPLVLDYTLIAGQTQAISTRVIQTGYSGLEFRPNALSDHYFLSSQITISDL